MIPLEHGFGGLGERDGVLDRDGRFLLSISLLVSCTSVSLSRLSSGARESFESTGVPLSSAGLGFVLPSPQEEAIFLGSFSWEGTVDFKLLLAKLQFDFREILMLDVLFFSLKC